MDKITGQVVLPSSAEPPNQLILKFKYRETINDPWVKYCSVTVSILKIEGNTLSIQFPCFENKILEYSTGDIIAVYSLSGTRLENSEVFKNPAKTGKCYIQMFLSTWYNKLEEYEENGFIVTDHNKDIINLPPQKLNAVFDLSSEETEKTSEEILYELKEILGFK